MKPRQEQKQVAMFFVRRWFCKVLFNCCEAIRPCLNFLQIQMLQPQTMDSKIKKNDIKIIKASCLKVNKSSIVYTVDTRQLESRL